VTAASLFDGHDASINIMRRILQAEGCEVIHLGHDRSVQQVVQAAIEEDAHGIAVSSYQGGHVEYFTYLVDSLRALGRSDIGVYGGGGGTITDEEIALLHGRGVGRIYSVEDGRQLGLQGMIRDMIERARRSEAPAPPQAWSTLDRTRPVEVARLLSWIEAMAGGPEDDLDPALLAWLDGPVHPGEVIGITGTGGAGKSSLTDELVRGWVHRDPSRAVAVLSIDPTRRRTGGALLGDRIRMNMAGHPAVFMRSVATRQADQAVSRAARLLARALRRLGWSRVVVETAGIGQAGSEIVSLCDIPVYVMTPEFGAPTQLEKIEMLDWAQVVAINKADRHGAEDARRYVARQLIRNRAVFQQAWEDMPVYLCCASRFADPGVSAVADAIDALAAGTADALPSARHLRPQHQALIPPARTRYLADVADTVRGWRNRGMLQVDRVRRLDSLRRTLAEVWSIGPLAWAPLDAATHPEVPAALIEAHNDLVGGLDPTTLRLLEETPALIERYRAEENAYQVRQKTIRVRNHVASLAGTPVPRVAVPSADRGAPELLRWRWFENVPGEFPFTGGVFPFKRQEEEPTRMFAGEGTPEQTNRRFHLLASAQPAVRLSTAFDSVTLYGRNPDGEPDVWGKIGNSGVNVCCLDDMKRLYSGFDLRAPDTSVSMTINGPAPAVLAMFLNTAIDQQVERVLRAEGRWEEALSRAGLLAADQPAYRAPLPPGHDGSGLGLLGLTGDMVVDGETYGRIRAEVLSQVRGTVQADILKEDQAQNTCIFSTEFALRMMADVQAYFVEQNMANFYSVSISGYHIAEAGANPITQLAFTLANGLTYVEAYLARGLPVDAFARNLSFFFSNGLDPEYTVMGRVARRIWAVVMRERYGAAARSQQLKYHIQTSGRSLHAQEIAFNDIRTTLQAFCAIADHCNSLHTNAYDEAITTPTEESVRRALAIQLILNREYGLLRTENIWQGSYLVEELTDLVEEAVLQEFERLSERGGVLGAMELMYQRSRIQEESMLYEQKKHSGELPIIGVNTFLDPSQTGAVQVVELVRASEEDKQAQLDGLQALHGRHAAGAPQALARLQETARTGGNVFSELMETVKVCSLGQITRALFEVGGQYRRNI
jgi:methylmalonyl-CoA mutase